MAHIPAQPFPSPPPVISRREALGLIGLQVTSLAIAGCAGGTNSQTATQPPDEGEIARRRSELFDPVGRTYRRGHETEIEPVFDSDYREWIPRTKLSLPAGDVISLHFPSRRVDSGDLSELENLLAADEGEQRGKVVAVDGRWRSDANTFNCCCYAVGDQVGFGPTDWITGEPHSHTGGVANMPIVLNSFYRSIRRFRSLGRDVRTQLTNDRDLLEGDVVCFAHGPTETFPHAGRIVKRGERNRILQKLGRSELVETDFSGPLRFYRNAITELRVYRLRPGEGESA